MSVSLNNHFQQSANIYGTIILDMITKFEDLESKSKCQKSNCYSKQKETSSASHHGWT